MNTTRKRKSVLTDATRAILAIAGLPLVVLTFAGAAIIASPLDTEPSCGLPIVQTKRERALMYKKTSWQPGQKIKVFFVNGTEEERGVTEHYAREWEKYGNFTFEFHHEKKTVKEHTILIKFEQQRPGVAGWSSLGSGTNSTDAHSMSFHPGIRSDSTILHEFGHALGLDHEQMSPAGKVDWIPSEAYKYFYEKFKWDRKKVDDEILNKTFDTYKNWTDFDHESVMGYFLPAKLFKNGKSLGNRFFLSELDKKGISQMYPGRQQPADRLATQLYFSDTGKSFTVSAQNANVKLYADGTLIKELPAAKSSYSGEIPADDLLKKPKVRLRFEIEPTDKKFGASVILNEGKRYIFSMGCYPEMPCADRPKPIRREVYLTHFRNRNRGQDSVGTVVQASPPAPVTVDSYSDLKGNITINPQLGPRLLNAVLGRKAADVRQLLRDGADPSASYQGWTALMLAAYLGEPEMVRMLTIRRADLNVKLGGYWTAYLIAVQLNRMDVAEILRAAGAQTRGLPAGTRSLPPL